VEGAIAALRAALATEDVEDIKSKTNELMQLSMKIGQAMYEAGAAGGSDDGSAGGPQGEKDDVIDADFREVGDDDKKKRA